MPPTDEDDEEDRWDDIANDERPVYFVEAQKDWVTAKENTNDTSE